MINLRDEIDLRIDAICERILAHAPVTMRVSKQAIGRLQEKNRLDRAEDLIEEAYGSLDFRTGVEAFHTRTTPRWQGR